MNSSNNILFNPKTSDLYKHAIHNNSNISSTGALVAYSGEKTGRCPKNKRVVYNNASKDIWWGKVNIKLDQKLYNHYKLNSINYLKSLNHIYQIDAYAGWNVKYRIKVRVYCTSPYHALFMKNMLIPSDKPFDKPDFTIYNTGELDLADYKHESIIDDTLTDSVVALDLEHNDMVIYGTQYAGEMKKGILTLMMYLMPINDDLTLHSSANMNINKDNLCFFFGLSGTGKTTLSADPNRILIGDDEHVWTPDGIFNVEGGCYAKCIGLKRENEPEIFDAIKYGAVLENIVMNENDIVDFDDVSITQNTRCSYPLNHIPNSLIPATVDMHPQNIIFLSCDATGVLPPVSKLTPEQAVYFFINGYTSKIAGTEVGVKDPEVVFSSCFGEPFIVWNPKRYGELLKDKMNKHKSTIWMLNTGWIEGPFGSKNGHRISLKYTRAMVDGIHNGKLINEEYEETDIFGLLVPKQCDNVDSKILNPVNVWVDKEEYMYSLRHLKGLFDKNYRNKIN